MGVASTKSWRKHNEGKALIPQQWADLKQALELERSNNVQLQSEVNRLKQDMQTAKLEGWFIKFFALFLWL